MNKLLAELLSWEHLRPYPAALTRNWKVNPIHMQAGNWKPYELEDALNLN